VLHGGRRRRARVRVDVATLMMTLMMRDDMEMMTPAPALAATPPFPNQDIPKPLRIARRQDVPVDDQGHQTLCSPPRWYG